MTGEAATPGWVTDALAILAAGQPVPAEQLADRAGARHGELLAFLRDDARLLETSTGWVDGLRLADGVAFVHELTATEREADTLAGDDDLALWAVLAADGLPLAGGGTVHSRTLPDLPASMRSRLPAGSGMIGQGIVGPSGWLAGYQPGDLLRVELRDGKLTIATTAAPPYRSEQIAPLLAACLAALGQGLERYRNGEVLTPAADLARVLADLLVTRPDVLAEPAPPLGARLHAAGWETFGGQVGFAGTAWDISPLCHLDRDDAVTATLALGMLLTYDKIRPDSKATIKTLHQALAIPQILGYLADQIEQRAATAGTGFGPVLDWLTATAAAPAQRAATALLAARAAEGAGQPRQDHPHRTALDPDRELPGTTRRARSTDPRRNTHTATEISRRAERMGGPPPADGQKVRTLVIDNNILPADVPDIPRATSQSWLNTTINALGMTPRQAATADSDTRTKLEAILDDIQWHSDRNREHGELPTMDVAWVRDQLGIPA